MNELQRMNREIRIYTLVTAVMLSVAGVLVLPAYGKEIAVGIMIGALIGLIGFQMIIQSASSLEADTQNPKGKPIVPICFAISYMRQYSLSVLRRAYISSPY